MEANFTPAYCCRFNDGVCAVPERQWRPQKPSQGDICIVPTFQSKEHENKTTVSRQGSPDRCGNTAHQNSLMGGAPSLLRSPSPVVQAGHNTRSWPWQEVLLRMSVGVPDAREPRAGAYPTGGPDATLKRSKSSQLSLMLPDPQ